MSKSIQVFNGGGFENLKQVERDVPKPRAGQILVKWHATSLNFHDYLIGVGGIKVGDGRIPMSDGAGEIMEVGADVFDYQVGDHVMSMFFPAWQDGPPILTKLAGITGESLDGFLCEYSCLSANAVTRVPKGFSFAEAATLPTAPLTAWNALMYTGHFKPGDKVLIEGTGGVSIFAMQMALAMGAKVYATSSSPAKAERLKSMGVEAVVNYREEERWGKSIFKISDGGVDHVLDVGGGSTMNQSIEACKIGGHITAIGILSDGRKGSITFPKLFFKFITMRGIAVGNRAMQHEMVAAIENTGIKPIIDKSFAFDEIVDAFKYQESGKHFGKIVVEW